MKHHKKIIAAGHVGGLESIAEVKNLPKDVTFCEHESYCIIRRRTGKICFNENNPRKQCQKFYDKYKEGGNYLGVGS